METDSSKQRQQTHEAEQLGELRLQDRDLEPKKEQTESIRGGAQPPNDIRSSVLPPDGKPGTYVLPPDE